MPTITTSSDAQGDIITLVSNSASGAPEAEIVSHTDGSRLDYAWLGLAADATLNVSNGALVVDASDELGQTYRLYETILGRTPDNAGFNAFADYLSATQDNLGGAAAGLLNSAEYAIRYGQPSEVAYVQELWQNGFGLAVDPGFAAYWASVAIGNGGSWVAAATDVSQYSYAITVTTPGFVDFLYNDNPSGFSFSARAFDSSGRLTQDGFNYLDGDSQSDSYDVYGRVSTTNYQHAYGNLNAITYDYSGTQWWSRYESDYGPSGQLLDNTANVTGGGSLIQTYSQSVGDAWWQKIDWFDGASGSGAWTKELVDNRDGTSSIIDTNPYKTEPFSYEISNFSGSGGTGSLANSIEVKSDGSALVDVRSLDPQSSWTDFQFVVGGDLSLAALSVSTSAGELVAGNSDLLGFSLGQVGSVDLVASSIELVASVSAKEFLADVVGVVGAMIGGGLTAMGLGPASGTPLGAALITGAGAAGFEIGHAAVDYLADHQGWGDPTPVGAAS